MGGMMDIRRSVVEAMPHLESVSGNMIHIEKAEKAPLKFCIVNFEPVQSGSGDPSPTNIRPINGWDGVSVNVSQTASGGTQYPVSWQSTAGTVYGGYVDLVSGTLTVTHGYKNFDGSSDEDWKVETLSIGKNFYIKFSDAANTSSTWKFIKCNAAKTRSGSYVQGECFISQTRNFNLAISSAIGETTVDGLRAWLANHNLQVVYLLSTPLTIHLTPRQISTVRGVNNIWSDAGNVEVRYWRH